MHVATLTAKGQVTVPKAVRDALGLRQADQLSWELEDGSVRVHRFHMDLVGLSVCGPKAREVLAKLVDADVSNAAFRFMDFREMDVASAPCMVNRITYSGDLGYEIWMKPAMQRRVYTAIKEAGAEFGIVDFGMRALLSMRLEKNFPTWFAELRPIYGPFEGAMDRFK